MRTLSGVIVLLVLLLPWACQAASIKLTSKQAYLEAMKLNQQGDWSEALRAAKLALENANYSFGRSSLNASKCHILLAELYAQRGKHASAKTHSVAGIKVRNELFGPNHVGTAGPLTLLGQLYANQGKSDLAQDYFTKAIQTGLDAEDPRTAKALLGLASLKAKEGKHDESIAILNRTVQICDKSRKYGESLSPVAVGSLICLAEILMAQGKFLRAANSYANALLLLESTKRPDSLLMYSVLTRLGDAYRNSGSSRLAANCDRRAIAVRADKLGPTVAMVPSPGAPRP